MATATLDWSQCPAVESVPGRLRGAWVFRDTRMPVSAVFENGIARSLVGHTVTKAKDRGWDKLANGDLLAEAQRAGFDVLLTADKNMRYQQNLAGRRMALEVVIAYE